jgi:hypothetical protein
MKGLAFLLVLVFVLLVALAIYYGMAGVIEGRRARTAKWIVHVNEAADSTEFWLIKGPNADFVGRALRKAPDYGIQFAEFEAEAEEMAMERNAAITVLEKRNK